MELHHRVELIDALLEEAEQKMSALHHALGCPNARPRKRFSMPDMTRPSPQEGQTLKYEQALWQRVRTGLTEVRTILEDLEESERQRGLSQ